MRCARCGRTSPQRFAGPCDTCRAELRGEKPAGGRVEPGPAVTARRCRSITPRATGWLDWSAGELVTDGGRRVELAPRPPVAELVELAGRAGVERVYLCGPRPHAGDPDAWQRWVHGPLPEGWRDQGHYLADPEVPVLRWAGEGRRVEVLRAQGWGVGDASPEVCRAVWAQLAQQIDRRWPGGVLLSTPATTGRELIARSIPRGVEWPTLPDHLAELVRSTAGQGRIEFRAPAGAEVPELVEMDGRIMYGALCRELPGGRVEHGPGMHRYGPYARARLRCTWEVPEGWAHLGLLPAHSGDGWRYPARPGERAEGWVDGVELHLAQRHGWRVEVHEHIVWPDQGGPLDGWARRLLDLATGPAGGEVAELVARAARQVIITTLGALVGRASPVTRSVPLELAGEVPAGARGLRVEGGQVIWSEPRPPAWPEMVHPEWPAAVWARCRARMLDGPTGAPGVRSGALHVPVAHVVAVRTDSLWLTSDPGWPDDGRPGRLRAKARYAGPIVAPTSAADLFALRARRARIARGGS